MWNAITRNVSIVRSLPRYPDKERTHRDRTTRFLRFPSESHFSNFVVYFLAVIDHPHNVPILNVGIYGGSPIANSLSRWRRSEGDFISVHFEGTHGPGIPTTSSR